MARRVPYNNYSSTSQTANTYEEQNDYEIDQIRSKVSTLKSLTLDMGEEIKSQNKFISSMDNDFDSAWGSLSNSMAKVKKLATAGHNCWFFLYLIGFSFFVFFVLYIMIRFR